MTAAPGPPGNGQAKGGAACSRILAYSKPVYSLHLQRALEGGLSGSSSPQTSISGSRDSVAAALGQGADTRW